MLTSNKNFFNFESVIRALKREKFLYQEELYFILDEKANALLFKGEALGEASKRMVLSMIDQGKSWDNIYKDLKEILKGE
jgi:hypothetical protein